MNLVQPSNVLAAVQAGSTRVEDDCRSDIASNRSGFVRNRLEVSLWFGDRVCTDNIYATYNTRCLVHYFFFSSSLGGSGLGVGNLNCACC